MAITKPPVLPAWAESGDKVTPSNAEIQVGWPMSSIPPSRQRFNWLLNFLANGIRYFSRRGLPDYDENETYMTGDRIIGDDGKTYRSLIDNNTAQVPSTSPTKWERWGFTFNEFFAGVTTPPQFDNDTSIATTAFVQRALGNFQSSASITANTVLTIDALGKAIYAGGAATQITIPDGTSAPAGGTLTIHNVKGAGGDITVVPSAGDVFSVDGGSISSLVIKSGDSATFYRIHSDIWYVIGTATLQHSYSFAKSLSTNGYQKLPSGLIIQWGSATVNDSEGGANVTLPIAFPNAMLTCGAICSTDNSAMSFTPGTLSTIYFGGIVSGVNLSKGATFRWFAIGY